MQFDLERSSFVDDMKIRGDQALRIDHESGTYSIFIAVAIGYSNRNNRFSDLGYEVLDRSIRRCARLRWSFPPDLISPCRAANNKYPKPNTSPNAEKNVVHAFPDLFRMAYWLLH